MSTMKNVLLNATLNVVVSMLNRWRLVSTGAQPSRSWSRYWSGSDLGHTSINEKLDSRDVAPHRLLFALSLSATAYQPRLDKGSPAGL